MFLNSIGAIHGSSSALDQSSSVATRDDSGWMSLPTARDNTSCVSNSLRVMRGRGYQAAQLDQSLAWHCKASMTSEVVCKQRRGTIAQTGAIDEYSLK